MGYILLHVYVRNTTYMKEIQNNTAYVYIIELLSHTKVINNSFRIEAMKCRQTILSNNHDNMRVYGMSYWHMRSVIMNSHDRYLFQQLAFMQHSNTN